MFFIQIIQFFFKCSMLVSTRLDDFEAVLIAQYTLLLRENDVLCR